jgi:hypothetical protein
MSEELLMPPEDDLDDLERDLASKTPVGSVELKPWFCETVVPIPPIIVFLRKFEKPALADSATAVFGRLHLEI